jgi:hypothetical protein
LVFALLPVLVPLIKNSPKASYPERMEERPQELLILRQTEGITVNSFFSGKMERLAILQAMSRFLFCLSRKSSPMMLDQERVALLKILS